MLIGVISDTHIIDDVTRLPVAVNKAFKDVELILHAGDIMNKSVLKQLSLIAPTVAVAGNGDSFTDSQVLGYFRTVYVCGYEIGISHGHQGFIEPDAILRACSGFEGADIVIGGHSHLPVVKKLDSGQLFINPGSCGVPKDERGNSVALINIKGNDIEAKIIFIDEI